MVLDLDPPKVHGLEVCRQIRQLHPRMKVIVFTVMDDPQVRTVSRVRRSRLRVEPAHGDLLSAIGRMCVD